jgi:hypothetical protein
MAGTNRHRIGRDSIRKPAGSPREGERRQGFQALGAAISKIATPIVAARGGGILVRLQAEWAAIAGPECAEVAWPSALGRDGVLKLRTPSGAALELQHRAPLLIERINLFFGRSVVTRLAFVQGALPRAPLKVGPWLNPLTEREQTALEEKLSRIADSGLRDALARLGSAVSGRAG